MSTVLVESSTGAQILPNVRDLRARTTAWVAYSCVSADQRATHPVYAALAATLIVRSDGVS